MCYIFSSGIAGPADAPPIWRQEVQFVSARACSVPPGTAQGLLCCVAFQTPSSGSGVDSVHSREAAGLCGLPWLLWTCHWLTWGKASSSGPVLQAYQNETFCFRIPASHGRFCAVKFSLKFLFISCTMWSLKSTVADWLDLSPQTHHDGRPTG